MTLIDRPVSHRSKAASDPPPPAAEVTDGHSDKEGDLSDLKRKSVRGGTVTLASQGILHVIHVISTVTLARMLLPSDYGIIAMVSAVTSFAGLFQDLGLSAATVQKKELTHGQQTNLFWLNVFMGTTLTVLVSLGSPLVAWFYQKPELTWVTVALSFNFVISSFGSQHGAILTRQMRFGRKAVASIAGSVVAFVVAVAFALFGYSYWALVAGALSSAVCTTALLFALSPFWPGIPRMGQGIREMVHFGANITGFNLVNYFHRNLDNILIGRFWGTEALGIYSRAYALLMFPIHAIRGPINAVVFPALSRLQHRPDDFRAFSRRATTILAMTSMPISAFLFLASDSVIEVLLGSQWLEVAPIFSVLALSGFIQPSAAMRGTVPLATGQGRIYLTWGIINAVCVSIGFVIGISWGAIGVATSYAIVNYALLYPSLRLNFRGSPLSPRDYFESVTIPAIASTLAVFLGWFLIDFFSFELGNVLIVLIAKLVVFAAAYIGTLWSTTKGRAEITTCVRFFWHSHAN